MFRAKTLCRSFVIVSLLAFSATSYAGAKIPADAASDFHKIQRAFPETSALLKHELALDKNETITQHIILVGTNSDLEFETLSPRTRINDLAILEKISVASKSLAESTEKTLNEQTKRQKAAYARLPEDSWAKWSATSLLSTVGLIDSLIVTPIKKAASSRPAKKVGEGLQLVGNSKVIKKTGEGLGVVRDGTVYYFQSAYEYFNSPGAAEINAALVEAQANGMGQKQGVVIFLVREGAYHEFLEALKDNFGLVSVEE